MTKRAMPESKEYWIKRGYSEEAAILEASNRKGCRSKYNATYWIYYKGYSEEDAIIAAENAKLTLWTKKENRLNKFGGDELAMKEHALATCAFSKQNMLKKMSVDEYERVKFDQGKSLDGKRDHDINHWLSKGLTIEDATISMNKKLKENSRRCIEYYIARGFSLEDSYIEVSKYQDNISLEINIKRYGSVEGQKKYDEYVRLVKLRSIWCIDYWNLQGYSEHEAIEKISLLQKENNSKTRDHLTYWLSLGYSNEDAENLRYNYCSSKWKGSSQFWQDRGFENEEIPKLIKQFQSSNGIKGAFKQRFNYKSSLEVYFDKLTSNYDKIWTSVVRVENKHYFPDFEFKNCFVEIYGDYWHANPNTYTASAKMHHNILAIDIWNHDKIRKEQIESIANKPVFIIWEEDLNNEDKIKGIINELSKYF